MVSQNIDHDRLYSFVEACQHIPSVRGGAICVETLHRWRKVGVLQAESRQIGKCKQWFIRGSELLRLLQTQPEESPQPLPIYSRAQLDAEIRTTETSLDGKRIK